MELTSSRIRRIASLGASAYLPGSSERSLIMRTCPLGHSAYTSVNVPPLSIAKRNPFGRTCTLMFLENNCDLVPSQLFL